MKNFLLPLDEAPKKGVHGRVYMGNNNAREIQVMGFVDKNPNKGTIEIQGEQYLNEKMKFGLAKHLNAYSCQ